MSYARPIPLGAFVTLLRHFLLHLFISGSGTFKCFPNILKTPGSVLKILLASMIVDRQERSTWRSGVRSAMRAAIQLPGRRPTELDDAPAPAC